jgi:transcriptional regulator of met regulon
MKITAETITDEAVRRTLASLRGNREIEYLCRAYLQFGASSMDVSDVAKLCAAINARHGSKP